VKDEPNNLEQGDALILITVPTPLVSHMVIARKANEKLRLGIEPQALNTTLRGEYYRSPILDDI
jgi:hypothetical protein